MQKDPRVYARGVAPKLPDLRRILGLDMATRCGVAFTDIEVGKPVIKRPVYMDIWDLSIGTYDSGALRHLRLQQFLTVLAPDLIVFEDVKFTPAQELFKGRSIGAIVARTATAAEFLGGLKITLAMWAETHGIPCEGIGISEIKKHATGKGNAGKSDMIRACNEKFGTNFDPETFEETKVDNIADAAWVMDMGVEAYSEGLQ